MKRKTPKPTFWVVGIGASAGGLEALSQFFRNLPEPIPACFVIAQHLAPHAKSMMVELISKQACLPVVQAQDKLPLAPKQIYIVPPNYDVTIVDKKLRLVKAGKETRPKPSVDTFFRSLAEAYGPKAVGIILSGTGTDGAEGIRAIKSNGGIPLAQDPASAKYDGMPKAAADTGILDAILSPDRLAHRLLDILNTHEEVAAENVRQEPEFQEIVRLLKKEAGRDFSQYRVSSLRRRMLKRMSFAKFTSFKKYLAHLREQPEEIANLAQELLVSVTEFNRDPSAFTDLRPHLEKIILDKAPGEELRIWIAGCATGEEAYTFAFLVNDICEDKKRSVYVKIFATDLDQDALTHARSGIYTNNDLSKLPKELVRKYFDRAGDNFQVKKRICDQIVFARQDLVQNPPFVKLDLVSCRNVLIYFEPNLQNRIFEIFHYALISKGVLFLGKSESVNPSLFEPLDKKSKIFRRINTPGRAFAATPAFTREQHLSSLKKRDPAPLASFASLIPEQVIRDLRICVAVVDEHGAIEYLAGNSQDFLQLPKGTGDFRIGNLLGKGIAVELSVLLKKAQRNKVAYRSRFHKTSPRAKKGFVFTVRPLDLDREDSRGLFLVVFKHKKTFSLPKAVHEPISGDLPARIMELEQEVASTREHLQTVIEELEISNEELQSLNEELSSTNEELQASNEELETTNEELQSSNEELTTLNEEVSTKSSELKMLNSSLENIQNSIGVPLLVVDSELNLLRYNEHAHHIFNVSTTDLHTSLLKASCRCEIPNLESKLRETIKTGEIAELNCTAEKRVFQLKINPCFDENKRIIGAVLIFFDNTDIIHAQEKLALSDQRIRAIVDGSPAAISLKDSMGRYLLVNRAFLERFSLKDVNVIGKTDREIFPAEIAGLFRDNDLEALLNRAPAGREERAVIDGKELFFFSNRFPLFHADQPSPYAIGTVSIDITPQVKAQIDLKESETRYRSIIEDQAVFVMRHLPDLKINFVNSAFVNFFGGTYEATVHRSYLSFVDKIDQKRVTEELKRISKDHPVLQYEHRVAPVAGSPPRWVRWIHKAIFDESDKVREYQAVGIDVTEIHNQTAELLQKENFYSHVLEHTSDYLVVYKIERDDFVLESINQSAQKSHGLAQSRLVGKKLSDLLEPSNLDYIQEKFRLSRRSGHAINFEEEIDSPRGPRYLSTTLVPIHDLDEKVDRIVAVSRDITKLKLIEQALRSEKKNAESANQAKSDFLAAMSHELRTPLNVITGMSQLLARAELKPEHQRLVDGVLRSSKTLLSLIEDVLDLSKIEAGKITLELKPFAIKSLCQEVVQSFESLAQQKGLKLEANLEIPEKMILLGDPLRLKQVLINLMGNAIKFTEHGSVKLNVSTYGHESPHYAEVLFEVHDTGVGIAPESRGKIFKRFSQADSGTARKFGGSGLGLVICKELIELMQGNISFDSQLDQGSVFRFKVQLLHATSEPTDKAKETVDTKHDRAALPRNVLVVDDNQESLHLMQVLLKQHGIGVQLAESGSEALDALNNSKPDLVLMDMQMPGLDGLQTTRLIRALPKPASDVPVIALTANAMSGDANRCIEAGMNDYLSKPINFDQLLRLLQKWNKSGATAVRAFNETN